jgi:citronellol/citronellal dehydrogenase
MVDAFRSPLAPDALAGQVAIVTGGGTGIGAATAKAVVAAGGSVAICGRRPEPLAVVAEALGERCLARPCDVREPEQVAGFLDAVGDRFEHVEVLVHSAGGQFAAPLEQTPLKGMRAVHRLNVDAVWDLTQQVAARWMIPNRRGFIAFLGFSPRRGIPSFVHSSMARSALETFAAGIALEWSKYGIRAVCVAPGLVQTEGVLQYGGQEVVDGFAEQVPMRRAGTPEEVAATIAFLASAGGAYITGTTVVVDGGADAWGMGERPPPLEP